MKAMTRKEYIVKYLCDKQHTIWRTTSKHYMTYTLCNEFVLKVTKDVEMNVVKKEKLTVRNAIEQLVRNFNQIK